MAQIDSDVVLGGRYRLVRRIASGGMGSVWEAEDTLLHRRVAVKALSEALAEDRRFLERFRREARATAGLSHPNVAGVFDYGEDGGRPYIVMELIEGETLAERLRRHGRLPWREAVAIMEPVASALGAAHEAGIIHRDVKPGNIMIARNGDVKVMDFGIAAATWALPLTTTSAAMGTATYISPEQASGQGVSPQSDVYSLGVVLYEMLTGRPPFTGETPLALAMAHLHDTPPAVGQLAPDVPEPVASACEQALAKDPSARPATAAAFAALLRAPDATTGRLPDPSATAVLPVVQDRTAVLPAAEDRTAVMPVAGAFPAERHGSGPPRGGGRKKELLIVALLGLVLLGAILATTFAGGGGQPPTSPGSSAGPSVKVPEVRGLLLPDAEAQLRAAGLTWRTRMQPTDGATPATVLDATPPPGRLVASGSSVTLSVAAPCGTVAGGHGKHGKDACGGGGGD